MSQDTQNSNLSEFSKPVEEALATNESNTQIPLLNQEEIDDEQPPRVNLTAVVCTAIVAVCATIILCVARPWRDNDAAVQVAEQEVIETGDMTAKSDEQQMDNAIKAAEEKRAAEQKAADEKKAAEQKAAEEKLAAEQKAAEQKAAAEKAKAGGLPILAVTKTGTANPYNDIRFVDASSRKLTKAEVAQMSKAELSLARNAIYARHGYVYKNAELNEFFAKQTWFKPNKNLKLDDVKPLFTETEVANINIILAQEKK